MGRSSSTGYAFLVQRNDAGQFTYRRDVSTAVARLVTDEVRLPWSGRTRVMEGKATIKISLGTGDEKTAKQRWSLVHPQVDALVQMAELRARGREKVDRTSEVVRLDPAQVRRIAEQAYHDVLATDDRGQVEPGFVSPLASVLTQVIRGVSPAGAAGVGVAELAARTIERRVHEAHIRRRTTWLMDKPIREGELGANALNALPNDLKQGDRLAPEQIEALAHGIRLDEIPGEVEQRLKENGLDLPKGHVDRRALALAITRAKVRALTDVGRRDRGAPTTRPSARPSFFHRLRSRRSRFRFCPPCRNAGSVWPARVTNRSAITHAIRGSSSACMATCRLTRSRARTFARSATPCWSARATPHST